MTEEERRNRNPAVEYSPTTRAEVDAMPVVRPEDLELNRVYILDSPRHIISINYAGQGWAWLPVTLEPVVCHQFRAPRLGGAVLTLMARDGFLWSGAGEKITIRRYDGPDA